MEPHVEGAHNSIPAHLYQRQYCESDWRDINSSISLSVLPNNPTNGLQHRIDCVWYQLVFLFISSFISNNYEYITYRISLIDVLAAWETLSAAAEWTTLQFKRSRCNNLINNDKSSTSSHTNALKSRNATQFSTYLP